MALNPSSSAPYPLYSTTYSLYRVSPLFTGHNTSLSNTILFPLASRFRDVLAGDVLRGVRVGLSSSSVVDDDVLARVGALRTVTWEVLQDEEEWEKEENGEEDDDDATRLIDDDEYNGGKGMLVRIRYEKAVYTGVLLRAARIAEDEQGQEEDGFQKYPLLLMRMPGSLREAFVKFLSTTFDVRVSALRLEGNWLAGPFETYIGDAGNEKEGDEATIDTRTLRKIIKDVQMTIGFDLPGGSASLKTVDIQVDREDVPRMVIKGKEVGNGETPFMNALTEYVKKHLALDLRHELVKITKIACGAFVLGDGRLKLTHPSSVEGVERRQTQASSNLVDGLIGLAMGGQLAEERELNHTAIGNRSGKAARHDSKFT